MDALTGWVKQPKPTGGLDHLGSQAPCINIYGKLLPGITNVTDRARYYSFYPWIIWAYERERRAIKWSEFIDFFRKADCLFTLIAARHANQTDHNDNNHGIGMVGRNTLVDALLYLEEGQHLYLSTYATTETGNANRYFKNKLGGLGQYYLGPFKDLGLLDGNSRTGVQYTRERAQGLAEAMDAVIDRKLFFNVIKHDEVTLEALDRLCSFCPCFLPQAQAEHQELVDLFLDRNQIFGEEGEQRRLTLCVIMHLIDELRKAGLSDGQPFDHFMFRVATYTGHLPGGIEWKVPAALEETRAAWAVYQRNEILSLACQAIFWVTLRMIKDADVVFANTSEFASHFVASESVIKALRNKEEMPFLNAVQEMKLRMPDLKDWENPRHEFFLTRTASENCQKAPYDKTLANAVESLLILAARDIGESEPYGRLIFPDGYFGNYPVNLYEFRQNCEQTWSGLNLGNFIGWVAQRWCMETHLRVALRKLRWNGLNTFKLQPMETGLQVTDAPGPTFTTPRFRQGLRMLRDLGAVIPMGDEGAYELTHLGRRLMGEIVGS